ncbi:MAG: hypothetical protein EOM59_01860 [Clostridia bacterium]|nr:hypothetical protein [Clostridia bacterium]
MIFLTLGAFAFVCFFIYDLNSIIWKNNILQHSFMAGSVLIIFSTMATILSNAGNIYWNGILPFLGLFFAVASACALIYTLFFALPFKPTYLDAKKANDICDKGVYALCRHPGFWCLASLFLSLYFMLPNKQVFKMAVLFNGLNFLYILFQDQWTFPRAFPDYVRYSKATPFLVPNISSIRQCIHTLKEQ